MLGFFCREFMESSVGVADHCSAGVWHSVPTDMQQIASLKNHSRGNTRYTQCQSEFIFLVIVLFVIQMNLHIIIKYFCFRISGQTQGLLRVAGNLGCILGPLWVGGALHMPWLMFAVMVAMYFISLVFQILKNNCQVLDIILVING